MTRVLLISCGAAETMGAIVDGDEILRFFFAPARGDELLPRRLEAGDLVLGRIKTMAPALSGAFIDIGAGVDAFISLPATAKAPPEGALDLFRVRRPELGGKGAVLDPDWRRGLSTRRLAQMNAVGAPRLLSQDFDPVFQIALRATAFAPAEIVVDQAEAVRALAPEGIAATCDPSRIDVGGLEEAIAAALEPVVALAGGARMMIEETAGGCVVDVDSGAAADDARKPNNKVNDVAARRLFLELLRRSIGGRIIVDFLPPSGPPARARLSKAVAEGGSIFECRVGKLAPDGLLDLTAPRRDFSLLERASEPAGDNFIRRGRRLTLDWAARRAIASLEMRLQRHSRLRLRLEAGAELFRFLNARPQWMARLAERHGARVTLAMTERPERSFDVVEI